MDILKLYRLLLTVLVGVSGLSSCETQPVYYSPACEYNEEKVTQMQQLAEAGDKQAQFQIASWYKDGSCLPQNIPLAIDWYHRSATQGYPDAQIQLGILYFHGVLDVPVDVTQGLNWFKLAAIQGNADAARVLGNIYSWGKEGYVPRDLDEAKKWYQVAVDYGDPLSQKRLDAMREERDREKHTVTSNSPRLIGDWKGGVHLGGVISANMTLHIEKQDAQNYTGRASISGGSFSCKGSEVILTPNSKDNYSISFSALGCRGEGKLKSLGVTLKGRVKFGNEPAKRVVLARSGYVPKDKTLENAGTLLLCLNPWTFWLCVY